MAYTETSSLGVDQAAYDRLAYFALRAELLFDQAADVQATNQSMPGSSVIFTIISELAAATSALSETTDVTPVAMADANVTVTLAEYGNAINTTAKLRGTAFLDVDAAGANLIGWNAGDSVDTIARDVLSLGTNVAYSGTATARANVKPSDIFSADNVRRATAQLRKANVATFNGYYIGFIHPDVSYDFRAATGNASWNAPHVYVDTPNIYNGEIGRFESVTFIETSRAKVRANVSDGSGSSTGSSALVDVYDTLVLGRQSLAKAYSFIDGNGPVPRVARGPVIDSLMRFHPIGWYWLGGYGIFREAAVRRIESASSIGTNT